jgi:urease accessory protein
MDKKKATSEDPDTSFGANSASFVTQNANSNDSPWVIWQLVDSLFPTGGFAHSLGLEAAVQEGFVKSSDPSTLLWFVKSMIYQTGNFSLPVVYSMISAEEYSVEKFMELHIETTAMLSNHVARKASIAQGNALLRLAMSTFGESDDKYNILLQIRKEIKRQKEQGVHHMLVFGLVCGLVGIQAETCQRMYLFFTVRDILSAATRLNLIGPMESARIQHAVSSTMEKVFETKKNRPIQEAYTSAPMIDLIQGLHDQLYTRIFNS